MKSKLDLSDGDDADQHTALVPFHHFQEVHSPQNLKSPPRGSVNPGDPSSGGGDGASIEVAKRRRGRPPGSKNKPKPPVVITREAEPQAAAMRPHVLEIPAGHDVVSSLGLFARRRGLGLCVLSGTGAVTNVALRQPPPAAAASICFHGRFEILSLSATFLPPLAADAVAAKVCSGGGEVSISLAGPQGQVVGGTVAGPLVAAGTVVVVAAAFSDPTFHRLPMEEDVSLSVSGCGGGGGDAGEGNVQEHSGQQQEHRHRRRHVHAVSTTAESVYGGHLAPDIIWAPAGRMPLPPPF
ncbi:AT-hook motif nuclear-localized protein 17-like [Zingiber officinale]|uniref:PPC domain-containing protein n=1 Tax=Zingiber officinale TaxID=94328 RepID=A0A8J5KYX4_ZINOF|nr:AT-hook motif nuclear-localized protein 17-like [Zingiber officinale]KAG6504428.1 hypothetical protein ZIOFF_036761 [Zingiber officinale]